VWQDGGLFPSRARTERILVMKSFVVLFFLAAALHFFLHVPLIVAGAGALILWIVWKLKYIILAVLGLEMLFNSGDDNA
jgi:hypothetical protein